MRRVHPSLVLSDRLVVLRSTLVSVQQQCAEIQQLIASHGEALQGFNGDLQGVDQCVRDSLTAVNDLVDKVQQQASVPQDLTP